MAHAVVQRIGVSARLGSLWDETWINSDADDVVAWRYRRLTVSSIENEVLTTEFPNIGVRPPLTNPLIARNANSTAAQEVSRVVVRSGVCSVFLDINHAKAAFCRAPDNTGARVHQLIERVMPEVVMIVTRGKLIQPIIVPDMVVRISQREVCVTNIWGRHRESNDGMRSRCYFSFDHATKVGREILDANDPVLSERTLIDDEIGQGVWATTSRHSPLGWLWKDKQRNGDAAGSKDCIKMFLQSNLLLVIVRLGLENPH